MIAVKPVSEPGNFDRDVRKPGNKWLRDNPEAKRPADFWSRVKPELAEEFHQLCGYSAMYEPVGTVDHFISYKNDPSLAYEWSNYRYAAQWINSAKGTADNAVLDPFLVEDGWFEIRLPSLQLVTTDRVPPGKRKLAEDTLTRLHLRRDERVMRQRREWYGMFQRGKITLAGLRGKAPLIARAVEKQQAEA